MRRSSSRRSSCEELLKPFSSGSGDGLGGDETEKVAGSDTLSSFGTEAVAKAIAKGGGLGIARQLGRKSKPGADAARAGEMDNKPKISGKR